MADEIKNLQNLVQVEWQDSGILKNSQSLSQVEWQDPGIMKSFQSLVQVEWAPSVGWTGKINGITNPAKINGIAVANIGKVMGVS